MRCIKCGVESKQALCSACFDYRKKIAYGKKKPQVEAVNCQECKEYRNHTCMETNDYISNPGWKNC